MTQQDLFESPVAIGMMVAVIVFFLMVVKTLGNLLSVDVLLKPVISAWEKAGAFIFKGILGFD